MTNRNIQKVVLATGNDLITQRISTDNVQAIKVRGNNLAYMNIDSSLRNIENNLPPVRLLLSGMNNTLSARNVKRIAVQSFGFLWAIPNVNARNNTLTFFSDTSATTHTVTIVEGFYDTRTKLMDALILALNTATGASGLTWSYVFPTTNPFVATLSTAGGNYYFITTSNTISKGRNLYCLPEDQVASNSKTVGPIFGVYTRHISIYSSYLTQFTKNPNQSNNNGSNNLLYRFYPAQLEFGKAGLEFGETPHLVWWNFKGSSTITGIDLEIRDEFDDPLYIPNYGGQNGGGFDYDLILITETE